MSYQPDPHRHFHYQPPQILAAKKSHWCARVWFGVWRGFITFNKVLWILGMFVGIPAVIIPVLGWFPQVRTFLGYLMIWVLMISFIAYCLTYNW